MVFFTRDDVQLRQDEQPGDDPGNARDDQRQTEIMELRPVVAMGGDSEPQRDNGKAYRSDGNGAEGHPS